MSTVRSSTSQSAVRPVLPTSWLAGWWQATRDVSALLRFRGSGLRGRTKTTAGLSLGLILVLTVLAGWLPAYLPDDRLSDVMLLLPSGYLAVLFIAVISASASGGGRELMPRDQAVAYPVSPVTDHLGALLMAPLNIAWLLQSWTLIGATSYAVGPRWGLILAQLPVLAWLVAATALAQVIAWALEFVRRGHHGVLVVRSLAVVVGLGLGALVVTDRLVGLLDQSPTVRITFGVFYGADGKILPWLGVLGVIVAVALGAIVVGGVVASAVARRPARDELRMESSTHTPRPNTTSDFLVLLRTDRVGIWRSVPLRRGLLVLALLPGLVALAGGLEWQMLTILPGLVASGGALLFGVNSWCLDGRGALWRDSLPVSPKQVFASRVVVLVEVLLVATFLTLALASLRAGVPTVAQFVAVLTAGVVVTLQVVATSLRWSVRRPFSVDMRSARATPAPPLVMVGYSAKLALSTTMTGLLFSVAALTDWRLAVLLALPFVLFSAFRLVGTAEEWATPELRSRVVATVAS